MFKYAMEVKCIYYKLNQESNKITKWSIKLLDLESELGFTESLETIVEDSFDYLKLLFQLCKNNNKVFPLPSTAIAKNKLTENIKDVLNLHFDMSTSRERNKINEIYFYLDLSVNDSIRILIHNEMVENDILLSTLLTELLKAKYTLPIGFNLKKFLNLDNGLNFNSQYDNLAFGNGNMYNPFSLPQFVSPFFNPNVCHPQQTSEPPEEQFNPYNQVVDPDQQPQMNEFDTDSFTHHLSQQQNKIKARNTFDRLKSTSGIPQPQPSIGAVPPRPHFGTGLIHNPSHPGYNPQVTATKMYDTMNDIKEKQDYELLKLILKILGKDLTLSLKNC